MPHEGFEANESVICTGGCPDQHLTPQLRYIFCRIMVGGFTGPASDVWGCEMSRLARAIVTDADGSIERCLPVEGTEIERLVADIEARRPDSILGNRPSGKAFLRATAHRHLRQEATKIRLALEQVAAAVLAGERPRSEAG